MTDAIKQFTGFDITGKSEDELREAAKSMGIEVNDTLGEIFIDSLSLNLLIFQALKTIIDLMLA